MTLNFQLQNKEFEDFLSVSTNGEKKELSVPNNNISFEIPDTDEAIVEVEFIRNDIKKIKNPIGRFFAYLFFFILSPIIFFADNDRGIGIHKFFYNAKPFELKKIFKIKPEDHVFQIKYIPSKYDKSQKMFSLPDIELSDIEITEEQFSCEYAQKAFKSEFRLYHYPAYCILLVIVFLFTALMTQTLIKQFSPFYLPGVIGMSFCILVMLALLTVFIVLFVFTHRLFRQIDLNMSNSTIHQGVL